MRETLRGVLEMRSHQNSAGENGRRWFLFCVTTERSVSLLERCSIA